MYFNSHTNGHVMATHHQQLQSNHSTSQALSDTSDDSNKKKRDRFKGMSEDEVLMRMLPDHLIPNLDIVIVSLSMALKIHMVTVMYFACGNILNSDWKVV